MYYYLFVTKRSWYNEYKLSLTVKESESKVSKRREIL